MWRAPLTKRLFGETHRVCGAGRSCDSDRWLRLQPTHHRGIAGAWLADRCRLGGRWFPQPSDEQRAVALALLEALPARIPIVVDGLALGALPEAAEKIALRAPLIALVHHPLALEAGLSSADAHKLFESERRRWPLRARSSSPVGLPRND